MRRALLPVLLGAALASPVRGTAQAADPPPAPVLTLEEAVRQTLERSPRIGIARNEAAVARNDHSLGNAGLLPSLDLTARQNRRGTGGPSGALRESAELSSSVSVTVFDGFRGLNAYRRLGAMERWAEVGAERAVEDAVAEVASLYFAIAGEQQRMEALREAIATSEERLRIAEMRLEVGSASQLAVNQARVDLNADRAALLRQETALAAAKAGLNRAIGREGGLEYRVGDSIAIDRSLRLETLRDAALRQNRDLAAAREARSAAGLYRKELRGEWLPTVDLVVGYSHDALSQGLGVLPAQPQGWTYGITVHLPVFDGFDRSRRSANARLDEESREHELSDARVGVVASLQSAYESYRNSLALVELEEENVALARQNVEVALERFRQGLSNSVELREVQNALTEARTRLVSARVQAKTAELALLELSGGLMSRLGD